MTRLAWILVAACLAAGCGEPVCGDGTREVLGQCVAGGDHDPAICGVNTTWDPALQSCVSEPPHMCDPGSTEPVEMADGTTVCVGPGSNDGCAPRSCPQPAAGRLSLCSAWITDAELDDTVGTRASEPCDTNAPEDRGACRFRVTVRDADDGRPLEHGAVELAACGRFSIHDIELPGSGRLAIDLDDAVSADYIATRLVRGAGDRERVEALQVYALRRATDVKWTQLAGLPPSSSLADTGVAMAVFRHRSRPVFGVAITADGLALPDDDYYFADAGTARSLLDPVLARTGLDGSVAWLGAAGELHSGQGGRLESCAWPEVPVTAIPGRAAFHRLDSIDPTTGQACE